MLSSVLAVDLSRGDVVIVVSSEDLVMERSGVLEYVY